jgi:hypothetical protein
VLTSTNTANLTPHVCCSDKVHYLTRTSSHTIHTPSNEEDYNRTAVLSSNERTQHRPHPRRWASMLAYDHTTAVHPWEQQVSISWALCACDTHRRFDRLPVCPHNSTSLCSWWGSVRTLICIMSCLFEPRKCPAECVPAPILRFPVPISRVPARLCARCIPAPTGSSHSYSSVSVA